MSILIRDLLHIAPSPVPHDVVRLLPWPSLEFLSRIYLAFAMDSKLENSKSKGK